MPTRERKRAYLGTELVTVLRRKGNDVEIRNSHGFVKTVARKDLQYIDDSEPNATLKYDSEIN